MKVTKSSAAEEPFCRAAALANNSGGRPILIAGPSCLRLALPQSTKLRH